MEKPLSGVANEVMGWAERFRRDNPEHARELETLAVWLQSKALQEGPGAMFDRLVDATQREEKILALATRSAEAVEASTAAVGRMTAAADRLIETVARLEARESKPPAEGKPADGPGLPVDPPTESTVRPPDLPTPLPMPLPAPALDWNVFWSYREIRIGVAGLLLAPLLWIAGTGVWALVSPDGWKLSTGAAVENAVEDDDRNQDEPYEPEPSVPPPPDRRRIEPSAPMPTTLPAPSE